MGTISNLQNLKAVADGLYVEGSSAPVFETLADAVEYAESLGWSVMQGGANIEYTADMYSSLTEVQGLKGGAETGTTIYQIAETAEGGYTVEAVGAGVGIGFGSLVASVLAGIGIGVTVDNSNNFWKQMCNEIWGTNYPPYGLLDYYFPALWQDDERLYVPYSTIKQIYDAYNSTGSNAFPSVQYNSPEYTRSGSKDYVTFTSYQQNVNPYQAFAQARKMWNDSDEVRNNPRNYCVPHIPANEPTIQNAFDSARQDFINIYEYEPNGYIFRLGYGYGAGGRCDMSVCAVDAPINTPIQVDLSAGYVSLGEARTVGLASGHVWVARGYENFDTHQLEDFRLLTSSQSWQLMLQYPTQNTKNTSYNTFTYEVKQPDSWVKPLTDSANEYDPTQDVLQNFPAWANNAITLATRFLNQSGEQTFETYLPLTPVKEDPLADPTRYPVDYPYPNKDPNQDPDTYPRTGDDPNPISQPWTDPYSPPVSPTAPSSPYVPVINPDKPNQPQVPPNNPTPTEDEGNTPIIPIIPPLGGEANALFTVYNPTKAQLNSLGGFLWSSNILDQIVRIFTNNPLDAIISLHILYATPTVGNNKTIKLGYLDSGVSALEVTSQYVNVPCGTIKVKELYGDSRDYSPYTTIHVFLPFIGIRPLKTEDVIGSNVTIDYKVDVFTGTVLCNITITKTNTRQILYTFEGNCSVTLPLTGADRSRMISGIASIGMAVATKNPSAGAIAGGSLASGMMKSDVDRSGNFSGNAGAMGGKKPYLIINRSIVSDAINYNEYYGFPAFKTTSLSNCTGYTRVSYIHLDDIPNATQAEKETIESLLKSGVIIN